MSVWVVMAELHALFLFGLLPSAAEVLIQRHSRIDSLKLNPEKLSSLCCTFWVVCRLSLSSAVSVTKHWTIAGKEGYDSSRFTKHWEYF
jgi:hypothetical protein